MQQLLWPWPLKGIVVLNKARSAFFAPATPLATRVARGWAPGLTAHQSSSDAPGQHIISGELTHAINVKKAKAGVGQISKVQPPTKENPQSGGVEFDQCLY